MNRYPENHLKGFKQTPYPWSVYTSAEVNRPLSIDNTRIGDSLSSRQQHSSSLPQLGSVSDGRLSYTIPGIGWSGNSAGPSYSWLAGSSEPLRNDLSNLNSTNFAQSDQRLSSAARHVNQSETLFKNEMSFVSQTLSSCGTQGSNIIPFINDFPSVNYERNVNQNWNEDASTSMLRERLGLNASRNSVGIEVSRSQSPVSWRNKISEPLSKDHSDWERKVRSRPSRWSDKESNVSKNEMPNWKSNRGMKRQYSPHSLNKSVRKSEYTSNFSDKTDQFGRSMRKRLSSPDRQQEGQSRYESKQSYPSASSKYKRSRRSSPSPDRKSSSSPDRRQDNHFNYQTSSRYLTTNSKGDNSKHSSSKWTIQKSGGSGTFNNPKINKANANLNKWKTFGKKFSINAKDFNKRTEPNTYHSKNNLTHFVNKRDIQSNINDTPLTKPQFMTKKIVQNNKNNPALSKSLFLNKQNIQNKMINLAMSKPQLANKLNIQQKKNNPSLAKTQSGNNQNIYGKMFMMSKPQQQVDQSIKVNIPLNKTEVYISQNYAGKHPLSKSQLRNLRKRLRKQQQLMENIPDASVSEKEVHPPQTEVSLTDNQEKTSGSIDSKDILSKIDSKLAKGSTPIGKKQTSNLNVETTVKKISSVGDKESTQIDSELATDDISIIHTKRASLDADSKPVVKAEKPVASKDDDSDSESEDKSGIKMAIIKDNFPRGKFKLEELNVMRLKILEEINKIPLEEALPTFLSSKIHKRSLLFACKDDYTAAWLKETFHNNEKIIDGHTLKVMPADEVPKPMKIRFRTNEIYTHDGRVILERLNKYHPEFKTDNWLILFKNSKSHSLTWFFLVFDLEVIKAIIKNDCIAYTGLDVGSFKIPKHVLNII